MSKSIRIHLSAVLALMLLLSFAAVASATDLLANSEVTLTLEAGGGEVPIVDPVEPDPEDEENELTVVEALSLTHVSDFAFGTASISYKDMEIFSTTLRPFIQVTDLRGTLAGWNVTAKLTVFTSERLGGAESLLGSKLELIEGKVNSTATDREGVTLDGSPITLVSSGSEVPVLSAVEGVGGGIWIGHWVEMDGSKTENTHVKLIVPAAVAVAGDNEASIIWLLKDTPI